MNEDIEFILESLEEGMQKAVDFLEKELTKVRAGKANPVMLDRVRVDYYGASTPINQVASVTAPDPRMLVVQPFDKSAIPTIERAITEANLGFNPQNDGTLIRIPIPMLTEERRKELVKQARDEGENAKISIRNVRRDHNDQLKKLKNDGVSEDMIKSAEGDVQDKTNAFSAKVDSLIKHKESEIMTI